MSNRTFVDRSFSSPGDYIPPSHHSAPSMVTASDKHVIRHNLFENTAPDHTRNYMRGLDVVRWDNANGTERSQLIINQKPGSLVLPWEVSTDGGIWLFLQETLRTPHSKDSRPIEMLLAQGAFDALGVWSLEAPAGSIRYQDGAAVESPEAAAVRELQEETGLLFEEEDLLNLLPGGLHVGGDINTKVSHLFAGDVAKGDYDPSKVAVEEDEAVGQLLAFRIRHTPDLLAMRTLTRRCAATNNAVTAVALQPSINAHL